MRRRGGSSLPANEGGTDRASDSGRHPVGKSAPHPPGRGGSPSLRGRIPMRGALSTGCRGEPPPGSAPDRSAPTGLRTGRPRGNGSRGPEDPGPAPSAGLVAEPRTRLVAGRRRSSAPPPVRNRPDRDAAGTSGDGVQPLARSRPGLRRDQRGRGSAAHPVPTTTMPRPPGTVPRRSPGTGRRGRCPRPRWATLGLPGPLADRPFRRRSADRPGPAPEPGFVSGTLVADRDPGSRVGPPVRQGPGCGPWTLASPRSRRSGRGRLCLRRSRGRQPAKRAPGGRGVR